MTLRETARRLASRCEGDEVIVTADGSTYFDIVADVLAGDWRTILRSGCYLTHDDGLYRRTSPLGRPGSEPGIPAGFGALGAGLLATGTGTGTADHGAPGRFLRSGPANPDGDQDGRRLVAGESARLGSGAAQ